MTEITGLECSHIDCTTREWVDGPTAPQWVPATITIDGQEFIAHYCPAHGKGLAKSTNLTPVRNFDLAAQFGRAAVPAGVVAEMDAANDADLVKSGITPVVRGEVMAGAESSLPNPDAWAPPVGPPSPPNGSPAVTREDRNVTEPTQALDIVPVEDVFTTGDKDDTPTRRRRRSGSKGNGVVGTVSALIIGAFLAVSHALNSLAS